jgi:hypothetical protein
MESVKLIYDCTTTNDVWRSFVFKNCVKWIMFGLLVIVNSVASAQSEPDKLNWNQSGNCWFAEPGFLYCAENHPYSEAATYQHTFFNFHLS